MAASMDLRNFKMSEKILTIAEFSNESIIPGMNLWSSGASTDKVDKFVFPKDYPKLVTLCTHYYRTDPLISNTINKVVDIGIKEYSLARKDCTDEEFLVYSSFDDLVVQHLRDIALEYLLSGLIVPEIGWKAKEGSEIDSSLNGSYSVPDVLWKRDSLSLVLRKTPIPNRVMAAVTISDEDAAFINNEGIYSDGLKDKETYLLLVQEFPEYVKAVKKGQRVFTLENPFVIRRGILSDTPYPTPYLLSVLELLAHKRNLRKMDYSIAARVIAAIMLIKMGDKDFPLTEDDDDIIQNLKRQMTWRSTANNMERVFQLFSNHTLDISWIMPDVTALLDNSKYEAVDTDILFGLGFPRIMLTGETAKTGTSQAEFALLSPAETIKSIRDSLLIWPKEIYRQVKEKNGFENLPEPKFSEVRLYDIAKLLTVADKLYERGVLSKTALARTGGFDFESEELPQRIVEQKWIDEAGIPEFPLMPFTNQADPDSTEKPTNTKE